MGLSGSEIAQHKRSIVTEGRVVWVPDRESGARIPKKRHGKLDFRRAKDSVGGYN
jgi:hypothetical protein